MAAAIFDAISGIATMAPLIQGAIESLPGGSDDKAARSAWTQQAITTLTQQFPGKSCLVVCTKHDASKLNGAQQSSLDCKDPSGATTTYQLYVFDDGVFVLQGDG